MVFGYHGDDPAAVAGQRDVDVTVPPDITPGDKADARRQGIPEAGADNLKESRFDMILGEVVFATTDRGDPASLQIRNDGLGNSFVIGPRGTYDRPSHRLNRILPGQ
jgi:hypothetical protein